MVVRGRKIANWPVDPVMGPGALLAAVETVVHPPQKSEVCSAMKFSKLHIAIAVGAGVLLLIGFFGYLMWLNGQPPVLAKSPEVDPLTKIPRSIDLNPMRDRTSERAANEFLRAMRDGHCKDELPTGKRTTAPAELRSSAIRRRNIHWFRGRSSIGRTGRRCEFFPTRESVAMRRQGYQDLISVTLDNRSGDWVVSSYDALY